MRNSLEAAMLSAEAAEDKKAFDIAVLDLRGLTYITDYFVLCSCGNVTQVAAVADWIESTLAARGAYPSHVEGLENASWILMDFGDVVIHIFDEQTRRYYNLDRLWGDAPRIPLPVKSGMTREPAL